MFFDHKVMALATNFLANFCHCALQFDEDCCFWKEGSGQEVLQLMVSPTQFSAPPIIRLAHPLACAAFLEHFGAPTERL